MTASDRVITELRTRAASGEPPSTILRWLKDELRSDFSHVRFYHILMEAFGIPLVVLRDSENWVGLSPQGTESDQELNARMGRWISQ